MKCFFSAIILLSLVAASSNASSKAPVSEAESTRPNIVFILVDDLGQRDLGAYGSTFYETPNIDRLSAAGVRFTEAYAACNVCSPTRASILTGRYPARVGITDWLPGRPDRPDQMLSRPSLPDHLALEETTFAETFRNAGYRTGFVGKWHLGERPEHYPTAQGFDLNIAGSGKGHPPSYFSPYGLPNLPDGPKGEHLDQRLTREAIAFMEEARKRGQPFLLYYCHYAVHTPLQARTELVKKYEDKLAAHPPEGPAMIPDGPDGRVRVHQSNPVYAAMVESMDSSIGEIMATLERLGVADNTILVFTSDNGGLSTAEGSPTSNLPLRAGKGWAYEGGVREPLIVSWPGRIAPQRTANAVVTSPDFFPTLLELAGLPAQPDAHVDGVSFAPVLLEPAAHHSERPVFWHYPHYSNQRGRPHGAVREGRWKLIEWFEDGRTELFDLSSDISEQHDVSGDQAEVVRELLAKLRAWREQVGARMPTPNPDYEPRNQATYQSPR